MVRQYSCELENYYLYLLEHLRIFQDSEFHLSFCEFHLYFFEFLLCFGVCGKLTQFETDALCLLIV